MPRDTCTAPCKVPNSLQMIMEQYHQQQQQQRGELGCGVTSVRPAWSSIKALSLAQWELAAVQCEKSNHAPFSLVSLFRIPPGAALRNPHSSLYVCTGAYITLSPPLPGLHSSSHRFSVLLSLHQTLPHHHLDIFSFAFFFGAVMHVHTIVRPSFRLPLQCWHPFSYLCRQCREAGVDGPLVREQEECTVGSSTKEASVVQFGV